MKPHQTLAYILSVFAILAGLMAVFPKDGIKITDDFALVFPTFHEIFGPDTTTKVNIDTVLTILEADSTADSLVRAQAKAAEGRRLDSIRKMRIRLQYPDQDPALLYPLFENLELVKDEEQPVRVLHYGDSQIEGDRMSRFIRNGLQSKFGGKGPGLQSIKPVAPSMSVKQELSDNWKRYTYYGRRDTSIKHKRYGLLASFARFAPAFPDSSIADSLFKVNRKAWIKLRRSGGAYARAKSFNRVKLFYGYNKRTVKVSLRVGEEILFKDSLPAGPGSRIKEWVLEKEPKEVILEFEGTDSPDVYAVSLEGTEPGIIVDNIPMRGVSGTLFSSMNRTQLSQQLKALNVKLIIFQYGGNTVPYIDSRKEAGNYARYLSRQMNLFRKMIPGVSLILIGPADMSVKEKGELMTHPSLEWVRDSLKAASFRVNVPYYDVYEVMGGRNSMVSWVNTDPPLAAKDFIHFSPRGARKIAASFFESLIRDYERYNQRKK